MPARSHTLQRDIPSPLTAQMAWLVARAEAWLAALGDALPHCPVTGSAGLAVPAPQRLALLAQLYAAAAPPLPDNQKDARLPDGVRVALQLVPRPDTARLVQLVMQNPELLALRQRLLDDTAAAVDTIRRHWGTGTSDMLTDVWATRDWKRATDNLQGLWLTQRALDLSAEGWLAGPGSLAALTLACRLSPDNPVAHLLLAEARVQRNLPQQAVAAATDALRLWPELGRARYVRAFAHWRLHQLALAEDDFSASLHQTPAPQGPELARRLRARGAVRLVQQKLDLMCEDFSQACALGDCDGLAHAREQGFCRDASRNGNAGASRTEAAPADTAPAGDE